MLYTMSREMKISIATQIARSLRECRDAKVLHNDIKPENILLLSKRGEVASKSNKASTPTKKKRKRRNEPEPARCRIKLIDFGMGGVPKDCQGYSVGTAGDMAPEVIDHGQCSYKSDIFAAGMCILEVWMGQLWVVGKDDEAEMKKSRIDCLKRLDKSDPVVAELLRRTLNSDPGKRPSAKTLQSELIKIRKNLAK